MSSYCSKVCSIIIRETFGVPVQIVADVLLNRGPTPLNVIISNTKLPRICVQNALRTMIQHFLVTYEICSRTSEYIYIINNEQTIELMRYPRYYAHVDKQNGSVSREILEVIVQAGLVSISKLIYICGFKVQKSNPDVTDTILFEQLELFKNTVLGLASKKYITVIPPPALNEESGDNQQTNTGHNRDLSFTVPVVDLKLILSKLIGDSNEVKLEEFPDANTLWRINLMQFHAEIRNRLVYEALERKFKPMIDPLIFKIIIDFGFEKHPWENEGSPISFADIKDRIESMPNTSLTSKFLNEHLEIIEDDPRRLVSKLSNTHGGHFSFNMKTALTEIVWSTVDRIITERHGISALRIFRLVKETGFVEQDTINEMGMIPAKDAKHLTYKLVEDSFINIKEIRKSYAANAPPGKVNHVFYVDINQVVRTLRESCYKSIMNLKQKTKVGKDKTKRLITKEERITRILVNMTNKKCTEQQYHEVRELLTPPERGVLSRYHFQSGKLTSGSMHVDETLFFIELFMKYHKICRQ